MFFVIHNKQFAAKGSQHSSLETFLGETAYLSCGLQLPNDQNFCYLYNPSGELVQKGTRCSLYIDMVTINDIGLWTCRIGIPYLMETLIYEVEVIQKRNYFILIHFIFKLFHICSCYIKNKSFFTFNHFIQFCYFVIFYKLQKAKQ